MLLFSHNFRGRNPDIVMFVLAAAAVLVLFSSCASTTAGKDTGNAAATVAEGRPVLKPVASYSTGDWDEAAAEIVAYHAATGSVMFVNAKSGGISILELSKDGDVLQLEKKKDVFFDRGEANSIAMHGDLVAVAVGASGYGEKPARGSVVILDPEGKVTRTLEAGYLPDMVTFSPDGRWILVANEGEPSSDYGIDPPGSISIISTTDWTVKELGFAGQKLTGPVRIGKPGAGPETDIEPEYIAVSPDSRTAWVSLQENNAFAIVDLVTASIREVKGLGFKDHSLAGMGFDGRKDGEIDIHPWPVWGVFMPDSIVAFEIDGKTYIASANEGDNREFGDYEDIVKAKKANLDAASIGADAIALLKTTDLNVLTGGDSDPDNDGDLDVAYTMGGRSFSIWSGAGDLVFDSGDAFERTIAEHHPESFNISNDNLEFDSRSEKKGPEPEAIAQLHHRGRTLIFIGMERDGGIFVYDAGDPTKPVFQSFVSTRNYSGLVNEDRDYEDTSYENTGDSAPEGFTVIKAEDSPTGKPLLVSGFELSGSIRVFEIDFE